jgi:hypothetical protein
MRAIHLCGVMILGQAHLFIIALLVRAKVEVPGYFALAAPILNGGQSA